MCNDWSSELMVKWLYIVKTHTTVHNAKCTILKILTILSVTIMTESCHVLVRGGDSSVVKAPDSWLKGRGFESLLEWRENFLLQGRLSVLTLISVSIPPLCYRSSTKKIPVILPKVQVTAKHAYTLCMWLCMKWHGAWLYGVHRTCAEMAAVSCGTSHASAVSVSTPLGWILKKYIKKSTIKLVTHVEPHASAVSLLKRA